MQGSFENISEEMAKTFSLGGDMIKCIKIVGGEFVWDMMLFHFFHIQLVPDILKDWY